MLSFFQGRFSYMSYMTEPAQRFPCDLRAVCFFLPSYFHRITLVPECKTRQS